MTYQFAVDIACFQKFTLQRYHCLEWKRHGETIKAVHEAPSSKAHGF